MKCLIVVDTLGASGAELQILSLMPRLIAGGIAFEVAALMPPYQLEKDFENIGVKVHRLDLTHRWALMQGYSRLRALSAAGHFQTVWATLFFGHLYSAILKVVRPDLRLVLWLQSPGYMNSLFRGVWAALRASIHGWVIRRADRVIACSKAVAKDYEESFGLATLDVIYNAVPHEQILGPLSLEERERVRQRYGVPSNAPLLTIAARYSLDKGHTYLLEAISILEQTTGVQPYCIAAGQGPLKGALERQAQKLGIKARVRFVGSLDQKELHRLMQSSDAVILPSLQESLGLAAVEAMALGTPTVLSDYYGLAEVAAEGAAFTALPSDAASLAAAIQQALTDDAGRKKVIATAHIRVEQSFTVARIAPQWLKVLQPS